MKKVLSSILTGAMLISSIGAVSVFADGKKTETTVVAESIVTPKEEVEGSQSAEKSFFSEARDYVVSKVKSLAREISEHPLKCASIIASAAITAVAGYLGYRHLMGSGPTVLDANSQGSSQVVLFGPASAGKSTLINKLTGSEFVVSETEGSTQSMQHADADVYGSPLRFYDTPGLHNGTKTAIEEAGIRQAKKMIGTSDSVFVTFNSNKPLEEQSIGEIIPALKGTFNTSRRVIAILNRYSGSQSKIDIDTLRRLKIFNDIVTIPDMRKYDDSFIMRSFNILKGSLMSCSVS